MNYGVRLRVETLVVGLAITVHCEESVAGLLELNRIKVNSNGMSGDFATHRWENKRSKTKIMQSGVAGCSIAYARVCLVPSCGLDLRGVPRRSVSWCSVP